ncbi:MAG: hypothetical protein KJ072_11570 [Verrucomicrobia bacterium]|nr:hypothetical protein [Verrucomicrobiota bacterium]
MDNHFHLLVETPEAVHGGRWEEFRDRYGDWGRDVALYLGRQRGRLKLQELARLSGGVGYTTVAEAIRRVRQQIDRDKACRQIDAVSAQLSKMKMCPQTSPCASMLMATREDRLPRRSPNSSRAKPGG